ncbi:glutamate receptor ionotropic, kainate 3-like [Macrobrachium rosenbergii]|uniref:glutamate receptor ionotropic, kainate 3-like n=1 Tax=Macrobrachium rosenbergii TaxID=79674 RepID=UPI0034D3EBEA
MAVFWPFSGLVWGLIGLSLMLIGPVAFVFYWLLVTYLDLKEPYSLASTSFNLFRSLVNQGNDLEGNRWPLRFVFVFWYLFCYNIYAMYSGTLTAYLAIPAFEPPIDSLTDLPKAARDGFTIGTLKASSTESLFRNADSGIYKEVWKLFDPPKSLLPTPDEGFDKVLAEKFVLINSEMNGEIRATVRGRDKYHFGRDTFYPHAYGIACNSGAPFRPKFDILLSWITEAGLVRRWAQEQINLVRRDVTTTGHSTEGEASYSLTLNHLQATFFLVCGGFALSGGALLLENVVGVFRK